MPEEIPDDVADTRSVVKLLVVMAVAAVLVVAIFGFFRNKAMDHVADELADRHDMPFAYDEPISREFSRWVVDGKTVECRLAPESLDCLDGNTYPR